MSDVVNTKITSSDDYYYRCRFLLRMAYDVFIRNINTFYEARKKWTPKYDMALMECLVNADLYLQALVMKIALTGFGVIGAGEIEFVMCTCIHGYLFQGFNLAEIALNAKYTSNDYVDYNTDINKLRTMARNELLYRNILYDVIDLESKEQSLNIAQSCIDAIHDICWCTLRLSKNKLSEAAALMGAIHYDMDELIFYAASKGLTLKFDEDDDILFDYETVDTDLEEYDAVFKEMYDWEKKIDILKKTVDINKIKQIFDNIEDEIKYKSNRLLFVEELENIIHGLERRNECEQACKGTIEEASNILAKLDTDENYQELAKKYKSKINNHICELEVEQMLEGSDDMGIDELKRLKSEVKKYLSEKTSSTKLKNKYNSILDTKIQNKEKEMLNELIEGYDTIDTLNELRILIKKIKKSKFSKTIANDIDDCYNKIYSRMGTVFTTELDEKLQEADALTIDELKALIGTIDKTCEEIHDKSIAEKYHKIIENHIADKEKAQLEEIISGYEKLDSIDELKKLMVEVNNTSFSDETSELAKTYCEKIQNRMNQLCVAELDSELSKVDTMTIDELRTLNNRVTSLSKEINNKDIQNKYSKIIDKYITQKVKAELDTMTAGFEAIEDRRALKKLFNKVKGFNCSMDIKKPYMNTLEEQISVVELSEIDLLLTEINNLEYDDVISLRNEVNQREYSSQSNKYAHNCINIRLKAIAIDEFNKEIANSDSMSVEQLQAVKAKVNALEFSDVKSECNKKIDELILEAQHRLITDYINSWNKKSVNGMIELYHTILNSRQFKSIPDDIVNKNAETIKRSIIEKKFDIMQTVLTQTCDKCAKFVYPLKVCYNGTSMDSKELKSLPELAEFEIPLLYYTKELILSGTAGLLITDNKIYIQKDSYNICSADISSISLPFFNSRAKLFKAELFANVNNIERIIPINISKGDIASVANIFNDLLQAISKSVYQYEVKS